MAVLGPGLLLLLPIRPGVATAAPPLTVSFLDVWQGDSTWIHTPAGQNILIDGGPPEAGPVVVERLRRQGVKSLDLLVISHPHSDHFGGLLAVVKALPVRTVWDSGQPTSSRSFLTLLQELDKQRSARLELARAGQVNDLGGGIKLEVLAPADPLLSNTHSDPNNNSIVVRLTFGQVRFLFPGDIEGEGTTALLAGSGDHLQAQILKVPHHGSRYTMPAEFLEAVRPEVAVISCGSGNGYGHPHPEALQRLQDAKVRVWRTDEKGTIRISTDGSTYQITSIATPPAWLARMSGGRAGRRIDLNSVPPEVLEQLPGLTPSLVSQILKKRPFLTWEELGALGIEGSLLTQLREQADLRPPGRPEEKVNVNTATLEELMALPGIGRKTAQRIIAGRPYRSIDDLQRGKGIKARHWDRIRERITVGGG